MQSQQVKAAKRSWRFVWISFFVLIPFSLLALVVLLWFGREYSGHRKLQARIESLKKQGYPTDDASLDAWYKDSTDPTNTDAWLALMRQLKTPEFVASSKGVPYLGSESEVPIVASEQWAEEATSLAFLEKWKDLYATVLQLSADSKPVRFPIVWDSYQTLLEPTQEMRSFAKLLQLRGRVGLRSRDAASVRSSIDGLFGLSRVNSGEPNLVSQLVSYSIEGLALDLLQEAIQLDAISESDLEALLPKLMASTSVGAEWKNAVAGERALALPIFADPKKAKANGMNSIPSRARDALNYIEMSQLVLEIPMEPMSDILKNLEATGIERRMNRGSWLEKFDTILTSQLMPNYASAVNAMIKQALRRRIAATAICVRLYEDRNKKLPDALSDLSELKIDIKLLGPTDKRAFGYKHDGNRALLWGGSTKDLFLPPSAPPAPAENNSTPVERLERKMWFWELNTRSP